MSDNGSNVALARKIITEKYRNILNVRCIDHCFNLISKDVLKHPFARRMVLMANAISTFFKRSHQSNSIFKDLMKKYQIEGGGLKTYVETRWTTVYEAVDSIVRNKKVLEEVFIYFIIFKLTNHVKLQLN